MSVLIRGMKMPKNCVSCMWHHGSGVCALTGMVTNTGKDCPLVEVPTPHGPLIDWDELSTFMYHHAFELDSADQRWDSGCWIRYRLFENAMKAMPTIIEAEGENE